MVVSSKSDYVTGTVRATGKNHENPFSTHTAKVSGSAAIAIGPYSYGRSLSIETDAMPVDGGGLGYTIFNNFDYAGAAIATDFDDDLGNATPMPAAIRFAASFTLDAILHNGKIMDCDATSNVVVTVPINLPQGFNVRFNLHSTGNITISPATDAICQNNKTTLALTGQNAGSGALTVVKQSPNNAAAQYVLSGDFL